MLRFYAAPFIKIIAELQALETTATYSRAFMEGFAKDDKTLRDEMEVSRAKPIGAKSLERVKAALKELRRQAQAAKLTAIVDNVEEFQILLAQQKITYDNLPTEIEHLKRNTFRAMNKLLIYRIAEERAEFFQTPQLFGPLVSVLFTAANKDIEEAGKCLGVGRGTACVFHLMRVMEVALKHIAGRLGIPYAPSWESYMTQISTQIAVKHPQKTVDWKRDEPFFKEILGDLMAVKTAWRNPTMHIVRHYDPDEAEDVFRAVKAIMCRIAEDASKSSPKAGTP